MTAGPSDPSTEDLALELGVIAHAGVHPATKLAGLLPLLSGLQIVRSAASREDPEHLALAVVAVLDRALQGLAGSPTGEAARILLGLDQDTRHYKLTLRRERAASELFPDGRGERTFRTKDEPELLRVVAEHILVLEAGVDGGAQAPPETVHPTVLPAPLLGAAQPVPLRRRRPAAAAAVALVVALLIARQWRDGAGDGPEASQRNITGTTAAVPFALRDQFTDPRSLWPAYDNADKVVTTTGGQYQVVLKKFPSSAFQEAPWADLPRTVRAEAKATKMSPEPGSFGVFCRSGAGERYRGLIDLNGDWRVEKVSPTTPAQRLAGGSSVAISPGDNLVALACTGGEDGQGPIRLTLSINGTVVAADVADPGQTLRGGRVGVEVVSNRAEVRVWFDDFVVTGL